ncbi:hypothetical protein SAMN06295888_11831 [Desulfonatronum zhilinae]|nr:hypothetical protein SAMN06295888_11831 [Desulfonatronum zhilinae]
MAAFSSLPAQCKPHNIAERTHARFRIIFRERAFFWACPLWKTGVPQSRKVFADILPLLRTYTAKWNVPTHHFDINIPHQGVHLVRELVGCTHVQTGAVVRV